MGPICRPYLFCWNYIYIWIVFIWELYGLFLFGNYMDCFYLWIVRSNIFHRHVFSLGAAREPESPRTDSDPATVPRQIRRKGALSQVLLLSFLSQTRERSIWVFEILEFKNQMLSFDDRICFNDLLLLRLHDLSFLFTSTH